MPLAVLEFGLQRLDLIGGQHAGVLGVLEIFFAGGGEQGLQFGQARMLLFQFGQHLRKLALQDVCVGDQFRAPAAGGDGFEVGGELLVPVGEGAAHLVAGQQMLIGEGALDAVEELAAQGVDVAGFCVLVLRIGGKGCDDGQVLLPPLFEGGHEVGLALLDAGVVVDLCGDGALVLQCGSEVGVGGGPPLPRSFSCEGSGKVSYEAAFAQAGVVLPEVGEGIDLAYGHAAVQVGAHVVGLGRRGVVDVAADVAVVVFGLAMSATGTRRA
jgi:hypothetical protein